MKLKSTWLTMPWRLRETRKTTLGEVLVERVLHFFALFCALVLTLTDSAKAQGPSCAPVPGGLISWWPGDGTAADHLGGPAGTLQNGAGYVVGKVGLAFNFDGNDDFVQFPDSPAWAFGANEFTVELWANFSSTNGSQVLVANDTGTGNQNKWVFWLNNGGLRFHINGPANVEIGSNSFSPNPGQWYHLAVVRLGTNYTFFVNGNPVSSDQDTTIIPDANAPLTLGSAEGSFFFGGQLDEIDIFNRALAIPEIQIIYAAGSGGKCVSPVQLTGAAFIGGSGDQAGTGIRVGGGAVYISGNDFRTNGTDGLVARFNLTGTNAFNLAWATNWPGRIGNDHFNSLDIFPDGTVCLGGDSFTRTADTIGTKDTRGILVKFSQAAPNGTNLNGSIWEKQTPSTSAFSYGGTEVLNGVAAALEGTNTYIYATGTGQNGLASRRLFLSKRKLDSSGIL